METKNLKPADIGFMPLFAVRGIAERGGSGVSAPATGTVYGPMAGTERSADLAGVHGNEPIFAGTPRPQGALGEVSTEHPAA